MVAFPSFITFAVMGLNRNGIIARIDADLYVFQPGIVMRPLDRVDFYLVLVPGCNVHRSIDVFEFNSSIGGERISVVKHLADNRVIVIPRAG